MEKKRGGVKTRGSLILDGTCLPLVQLQDKLDAFCVSVNPETPYARFDAGDENDRQAMWRCFSGDALDFQATGQCVDEDGSCRACQGDRISLDGKVEDADTGIIDVIKTAIGKPPTCTGTLQHHLDHYCAKTAGLSYARHTQSVGATRWDCVSGDALDFGEYTRSCVADDGGCGFCRGSIKPFAELDFDYDAVLKVCVKRGGCSSLAYATTIFFP